MANSRPWKLTARPPVRRTVVAEDHVTVKIEIPPILPPERQGDILAGVLRRRGFRDDPEGGTLSRERGGVEVTVEPDSGEVTVRAEAEVELPPPPPDNPCTCRARESLRAEERSQTDLQREVTRRLEGVVSKLGCELEGVAAETTRQALKEKAAELGEVKEITEDPRSGDLTIVVAV
jgi:hypothetical protein